MSTVSGAKVLAAGLLSATCGAHAGIPETYYTYGDVLAQTFMPDNVIVAHADYTCPDGSIDTACKHFVWPDEPLPASSSPPETRHGGWSETFTLTGGAGDAWLSFTGGVESILAYDVLDARTAPNGTGYAASNQMTFRRDGAVVSTRRFDLDGPLGTRDVDLAALGPISVTYGVPFTLTLDFDSYARGPDTFTSADCPPITAELFSCSFTHYVSAEQYLKLYEIGVPRGASLEALSGTFYPVVAEVPEPAAPLLWLGGLALMAARRHRRGSRGATRSRHVLQTRGPAPDEVR